MHAIHKHWNKKIEEKWKKYNEDVLSSSSTNDECDVYAFFLLLIEAIFDCLQLLFSNSFYETLLTIHNDDGKNGTQSHLMNWNIKWCHKYSTIRDVNHIRKRKKKNKTKLNTFIRFKHCRVFNGEEKHDQQWLKEVIMFPSAKKNATSINIPIW